MKLHYMLIIAAALMALPACERRQTPGEKIGDKIDDALDQRPAEGVRDAVEDIKEDIKEKRD